MSKPVQADAFTDPGLRFRATFTFPAQLAKDISRLAKRMGVSQSALLSELLAQPVAAMCAIIDEIPTSGATPSDVKRARGRSLVTIREAVTNAQNLAAELDE